MDAYAHESVQTQAQLLRECRIRFLEDSALQFCHQVHPFESPTHLQFEKAPEEFDELENQCGQHQMGILHSSHKRRLQTSYLPDASFDQE